MPTVSSPLCLPLKSKAPDLTCFYPSSAVVEACTTASLLDSVLGIEPGITHAQQALYQGSQSLGPNLIFTRVLMNTLHTSLWLQTHPVISVHCNSSPLVGNEVASLRRTENVYLTQ